MTTFKSTYNLNETLGRIVKTLIEHDMTIFTIIDHSGGATQVGLTMPNTKLVIFGNPEAGTELMLRDPAFSMELPLRIVVKENNHGTEIMYQKILEIASRYELTELESSIRQMDKNIVALIKKAVS